MTDTVVMPATAWHKLCHKLKFDSDRNIQFEQAFNCKIRFKSNLDSWNRVIDSAPPEPSMLIKFNTEREATHFALKWL